MKKRYLGLILLAIVAGVLSGCAKVDSAAPQQTAQVVDVDLTKMSSTMVYAEVYNIMNEPKPYLGKTMKLRGEYYSNYIAETEQSYHFLLINDATACCEQGIEFVLDGEANYPQTGEQVEIVGVFSDYQEDGVNYCHVVANDLRPV